MKVVQFGLRYSPNLGDGVIAECLSHAIRAQHPSAEVVLVDISGRTDFGAAAVRNREAILRLLRVLPRPVRNALVRWRLGRLLDRVSPRWAQALEGADLAVIGGGQIFADADLNFPLKIARVAQTLAAAQVPAVIHAAGVQQGWSRPGRDLFTRVFAAELRRVALRDEGSISAWRRETGGQGPAPVLARDPGLLAAECYGPARPSGRIGLCITDPAILRYHADTGVTGGGLGFYRDLARAIAARGHRLAVFTNGAAEDRAALARLAADPAIADMVRAGTVRIANAAERPADLARCVGGFRGVVAHRLHTCILAHAYHVPVVGLGWDRKVEGFFASIGCPEAFAGETAAPEEIAERLQARLALGVDPSAHARTLQETRAAIAEMLHCARRSVNR